MKNKILSMTIFGVLFTLLPLFIKFLYFEYMPVSTFIDIERLEFVERNPWDDIQVIYSYRDSKYDTIWDIYYKFVCNWTYNSNWKLNSKEIIFEKTDGLIVRKVERPVILDLPKWECLIEISMDINIRGHIRDLDLKSTLVVN